MTDIEEWKRWMTSCTQELLARRDTHPPPDSSDVSSHFLLYGLNLDHLNGDVSFLFNYSNQQFTDIFISVFSFFFFMKQILIYLWNINTFIQIKKKKKKTHKHLALKSFYCCNSVNNTRSAVQRVSQRWKKNSDLYCSKKNTNTTIKQYSIYSKSSAINMWGIICKKYLKFHKKKHW